VHPRFEELIRHLDRHRAELTQAVGIVPVDRVAERPGRDRWSVAEILEHLAIVERRLSIGLAREIATARRAGLGPETETTSVMDMLNLDRLLDRTNKLTSGEASQPTGIQKAEESLVALRDQRVEFKHALQEADGLALGQLSLPHPRFGQLNGYQWVLFAGAHEGRHAAQIREVVQQLETAPK
jgi:uncharacterized damage-inducible protein DinB